jgi:hypothetical protein
MHRNALQEAARDRDEQARAVAAAGVKIDELETRLRTAGEFARELEATLKMSYAYVLQAENEKAFCDVWQCWQAPGCVLCVVYIRQLTYAVQESEGPI